MNITPLTAEQAKLAADNHNLIYYVLNLCSLSAEEYYDIAAIGLCQAAIAYKDGAFSTLACVSIKHEIFKEITKQKCKKRYAEMVDLEGHKALIASNDTEGEVFARETLRKMMKKIELMKPKPQRVMRLTVQGYSQKEIAKTCGLTHQRIQQIVTAGRGKLRAAI